MAIPLLTEARRRPPGPPTWSTYREIPVAGPVRGVASCAWTGLTGWRRTLRLLPDAAADLVWTGEALMIEPAHREAVRRALPPGRRHLGLRLRPGTAGAVLGAPMDEVGEAPVRLRDLLGARAAAAEARLAEAPTLAARRAILEQLVAGAAPDARVQAVVRLLQRPGVRIDEVGERVGLAPRDLRRRFQAAVGLSPKAVQRIVRFQRALAALRRPGADLALVALDAGYADQAHMSHEMRRLAGATPAALRATA